ncbi:MAG: tRNA (adenosine(37)-N6)-threonylcarbamoyltransferase complex transferase subunit TsaD [Deltaproteobacteria bacterium]|jgi:N6-L-threonylcarbamoyladenine synthase|nr:tRNA (adenosine(37)-N6)-threonylcarbamoyltransferase complex transferase subunit TsaD [Deltaproteobacteria bacterium]
MLILGIESSCDETAAALLDDCVVLSEVVRSQIDLHRLYGGVVPEIASRAHLEAVEAIVGEVLEKASVGVKDLRGVAVTQGPGLVGALLVAINFAKGLKMAAGLPVSGVNHVQAHALAPFMHAKGEQPSPEPRYPLAALVASGGHTSLFLINSPLEFTTLGRTLDDAAGEAFDKCAKLMGLGYPGGRLIEELSKGGNADAFKLTRPLLKEGLNFSFSGLKTKVQTIYANAHMDDEPSDSTVLKDLACSFQTAVVDVLVHKLSEAARIHKAKGVVVSGGVAANGALRKAAKERFEELNIPLYIPRPSWCADNAAMIALLGGIQLNQDINILDLDAEPRPRWPVGGAVCRVPENN